MDSYLDIARKVLWEARQPLSAREILKAAYQLQIVPRDLFGRTQHKTLQARLSTDILKRRSRSDFYRTGPGRFFLRTMLCDRSLPSQYRREYIAPLRAAQLGRFDVVGFPRSEVRQLASSATRRLPIGELVHLHWRYYRMGELRQNPRIIPFRFLVIVIDDGRVLLNNRRPPEEGDLPPRSTVGLVGAVKREDRSLFSSDEVGLPDAAVRTLIECLDLPASAVDAVEEAWRWSQTLVLFDEGEAPASDDLMAIISFSCAGISEVIDAIDTLATMDWLRLPVRANDPDRFDRWSLQILADYSLEVGVCG